MGNVLCSCGYGLAIYVFCVDMAYGLYTYLELYVESRFEVKKRNPTASVPQATELGAAPSVLFICL